MGEFFKTNKFKIILAILAVLLGMMLYSASGDGVKNIPKNLLSMVTTPFQKAGSWVSTGVGGFFDDILNYKNTVKENEVLKEEIAKLNQQLVDYQMIKDENEQLREMSKLKERFTDFTLSSASVVSRDPADRYCSFIIDSGSLDGVKVNDPVLANGGLVGIVTDVGPINCRVRTILSPEVKVSVIELISKDLGVLEGEISLSEEGLIKLAILSEETKIKKGDMIVTAGASGIFPKGVPIGHVREVDREAHGATMYAVVEPLEPIEDIVTVQVVTAFKGQGSSLVEFLEGKN